MIISSKLDSCGLICIKSGGTIKNDKWRFQPINTDWLKIACFVTLIYEYISVILICSLNITEKLCSCSVFYMPITYLFFHISCFLDKNKVQAKRDTIKSFCFF